MKKKSKVIQQFLLLVNCTLVVLLISNLFLTVVTTAANNSNFRSINVHIQNTTNEISEVKIYYKLTESSEYKDVMLMLENSENAGTQHFSADFNDPEPYQVKVKVLLKDGKEAMVEDARDNKGDQQGNGTLHYWINYTTLNFKDPVTPPGGNEGTPPGGDEGTPPGGNEGTPPGGDEGTPPGGDEGTPPGGDEGTPPGGDEGTPPGGDEGTPPGGDEGTPPGGDEGTKPVTTPANGGSPSTENTPKTEQPKITPTTVTKTVSGGELPKTASPWMNILLLSGLLALTSSASLFVKTRKQ